MFRRMGLLVAVCALSSAAIAAPLTFTKLYVFGDSLSDVGNVYAVSKLKIVENGVEKYNGDAKFPGPKPPAATSSGLVNAVMGTRYNYTVGRFTDGKDTIKPTNITGVWNEVLAGKLGVAVPTHSLANGTNYAFGGAETRDGVTNIPNTNGSGTISITASADVNNLGEQAAKFKTSLGGNNADDKALYAVWAGGNDVINTTDAVIKNNTDPAAIVTVAKTAVSNLKAIVKKLYDLGARNILWPNLPPMEKIPYFKTKDQAIRDKLADASKAFDTDEKAAITDLMTNNAGLNVTRLDILGLFNGALANPGNYGFTNIDEPAQVLADDPDKYVFWDTIHPTTRTHQLIDEAAFAVLPEPATGSLVVLILFAAASTPGVRAQGITSRASRSRCHASAGSARTS